MGALAARSRCCAKRPGEDAAATGPNGEVRCVGDAIWERYRHGPWAEHSDVALCGHLAGVIAVECEEYSTAPAKGGGNPLFAACAEGRARRKSPGGEGYPVDTPSVRTTHDGEAPRPLSPRTGFGPGRSLEAGARPRGRWPDRQSR